MKTHIFFIKILTATLLLFSSLTFNSCSSDDDDSATDIEVMVNGSVLFENGDDFDGDIDGDFTGNGGTDSRTFVWNNNLSTADYNADITSSAGGSFKMTVRDSEGTVVLDRSLIGNTEPDSFSGVTSAGVAGLWSVTIALDSFNGDGSFSLSAGD